MVYPIIWAACLSCGRVPIDSAETVKAELVEQNKTREFSFEIGIPKDLFDAGWRGYSFEMKPPFPDYYRAIQFNRLFVLAIGADKKDIIPPLTNGNPDAQAGLMIYVYDRPSSIPSFAELIDIVKSLEHKVNYWNLNGSVAAELEPLYGSGNIAYRKYPHATSYVPRLILSSDRFVYFLTYWQKHDIMDIQHIVGNFRLIPGTINNARSP
jgi:hypothetical protein